MQGLILIKMVLTIGLGSWLGLACWHNIFDRKTNRLLIGNMISMEALQQSEVMGKGLLHRAYLPQIADRILWLVVIIQATITVLFFLTLLSFIGFTLHVHGVTAEWPIWLGNLSVAGFISIWFFFLIGGLWFGYWIHMAQVQLTHLVLLIIGLLTAIIFNLPM